MKPSLAFGIQNDMNKLGGLTFGRFQM